MKKLLAAALLLLASPFFGQTTVGYHRLGQVLSRASGGAYAVVQPNATVNVTKTSDGTMATIYSDPGLSITITGGTVTADNNGNYGYYIPLNYCVTEKVSYPTSGVITTPNICSNSITSPVAPLTVYSAAGTALPSCTSGLKGAIAIVSDATGPTFLGAYASGGAVVSPVMCNGTGWVTY